MSDYPHIGTGWSFPPRWTQDTDGVSADRSTGERKVAQSMRIIVRTDIGERRMRPLFGADANRFVFEPTNGTSVEQLAFFTQRALKLWEPRILLDDVSARQSTEPGRVDVVVDYRIDRHRKPNNLVIPFYPEPEGRA